MKSELRIVPFSALRDNYIWSLSDGRDCVLVDPGEATPAQTWLQSQGLKLSAILLTHHHADHTGGVTVLRQRWPVPVFGPTGLPEVDHPLKGGETFDLPGLDQSIEVLAVPGHTPEHLAYLGAGALFCGDTLFGAGCGRLLGGTASQLHASLNLLARLPGDTQVCCAHEYTLSNLQFAAAVEPNNPLIAQRQAHCVALRETGQPTLPGNIAEELATNPFLRCDQASVRSAAKHVAGHALATPLDVFTALRAWKDRF
ncbi:MAG: hydroxyacylglutathione hydrolase [Candidatus Dactylopiibacterium carminicum]|uniref:Hydroxyacylglutathione hydrolase n=1 Tax=Candidatus Dactylopiibacterium carminicum TaxID=857335 RepID=A0A272EU63_9RHOO|nr:hydroxyacylglutathione hydrolase [Candidatus Dactylopiibacterium carminicum]KAF7599646.1 hydroxyacylglutathione hydrolase [Candidatus Dactylopiibacterium carminicum]PAS93576.1 MAG: hydroxyacylglutathione hydrolase [Candidatus Dactylopiibacterium carminicum]PAS97431.1 MAG: hydroxyacylglutathione hydrolase [Candidatus Dactylopiibacterium carminicum]PAS99647.1 MAG: hydroxyacylglutathione hydrolase [Candidatus Dactylopiibacterium carminicum]